MATQPKPKPKPEPDPPEPEPGEEKEEAAQKTGLDDGPKLPRSSITAPRAAQTFGEKAVGITFNPSGDASVNEIKQLYAQIIDLCHDKRQSLMAGSEAHRLWTVAITEAQTAQMWGVKAATWKD